MFFSRHKNNAFTIVLLLNISVPLLAQTRTPGSRTKDVDADIAAVVRQVSAAQIRRTIERLVSFGNRNTIGTMADRTASGKQPGVVAAREWIKAEFDRYSQACGGCLEVKTDTFIAGKAERIPQPAEITSVYAILHGTDPEAAKRIYLVTGHYDSRNSDTLNTTDPAPGANDDASGTAVSIECARVLSKHRFPATLIFMAVAGEEQGLVGSRHFAKMAREQGWNIAGVLNNDIVGGNKSKDQDPSIVRVFSEGIPLNATFDEVKRIRALGAENDSPSRQIARYVREIGKKYLASGPGDFQAKLVFRPDRYLRGGDHTAFNENGFPAVRFTEYREDYNRQHQNVRVENGIEYGDLPKFVDYEYVANVARLNASTLASLAAAPAPPANVRLLTKQLENDSTLVWEPSPDGTGNPDGAYKKISYEVVWRPPAAAEWENAEPLTRNTQATIKRSKDNVIFAVRAVDSKGNRSLPAMPTPER
jgi:hypothetical protein